MQVHELVARFAAAVETADPMGAARKALEDLRGEIDHIEKMLAYISGIGGNARQVFYRSPNLTMLKVCFPNGRRTPPHDHGTWATILLLSGEEKNTMYRRENGRLRRVGEVTLTRGEILPMPADTVHVAECLGDKPTIGLHVYGGDIMGEIPRHMWDPQTLTEHRLDWDLYPTFAQAASQAPSALIGLKRTQPHELQSNELRTNNGRRCYADQNNPCRQCFSDFCIVCGCGVLRRIGRDGACAVGDEVESARRLSADWPGTGKFSWRSSQTWSLHNPFEISGGVAPHTHPDSREITILFGTVHTGYGDKFDAEKLKALPAGSFYTEPANVSHFLEMREAVMVQVSGMGPSGRKFVNPADNPK